MGFDTENCIKESNNSEKRKIGFLCSYVPVEIIRAFDVIPVRLKGYSREFITADSLLHNNLCFYVRSLLETIKEQHTEYKDYLGFVFVNSCDAMKRLYDVFLEEFNYPIMNILEVPKHINDLSINLYTESLRELTSMLSGELKTSFDENKLKDVITEYNNKRQLLKRLYQVLISGNADLSGTEFLNIIMTGHQTDVYIFNRYLEVYLEKLEGTYNTDKRNENKKRVIVNGSILDSPTLLKLLERNPQIIAIPESCITIRNLDEVSVNQNDTMKELAQSYLNKPPCGRMYDYDKYLEFFDNTVREVGANGVLYYNIKFCDPYSCTILPMKEFTKTRDIPFLQIEGDYGESIVGPTRTRIEAFVESISDNDKHHQKTSPKRKIKIGVKRSMKNKNLNNIYFAGIDSGSLSTDCVIINGNGDIISSEVVLTGPLVKKSARKVFDKALSKVKLSPEDISRLIATGYGRDAIEFVNERVTEITCHAKGVHTLFPKVRTIIDVGGQDSKAISLNEKGKVIQFRMNDKCAAGTGRFLEVMAKTLEIPLNDMGKYSLRAKKLLNISSMCTVFAESEVVSLIAEDHKKEDIVYSLHNSITKRIMGLVERVGKKPEYAMSGGVAKNKGVVTLLEKHLGKKLNIAKNPQIVGAFGASIIARDKYLNNKTENNQSLSTSKDVEQRELERNNVKIYPKK